MSASNNHRETALAVFMMSTAALVLLCLLIASYKTGKMVRGRHHSGMSLFVDRKHDPFGYWLIFIMFSLICASLIECDIWILIHGV